jgi:hypothetical protein
MHPHSPETLGFRIPFGKWNFRPYRDKTKRARRSRVVKDNLAVSCWTLFVLNSTKSCESTMGMRRIGHFPCQTGDCKIFHIDMRPRVR